MQRQSTKQNVQFSAAPKRPTFEMQPTFYILLVSLSFSADKRNTVYAVNANELKHNEQDSTGCADKKQSPIDKLQFLSIIVWIRTKTLYVIIHATQPANQYSRLSRVTNKTLYPAQKY